MYVTDSIQPRSTWYGGTWPRGNKAASVTQVVKESISASGGAAADLLARARPDAPNGPSTSFRNPAPYLSRSIGSSSRSLPLAATTTKLNITSNSSSGSNGAATVNQEPKDDEVVSERQNTKPSPASDKPPEKDDGETAREEQRASGNSYGKATESGKPILEEGAGNDTAGWLGWFSKPAQFSGQNPVPVHDTQENGRVANTATQALSDPETGSSQKGNPREGQRRNSDPNPVPMAIQQEQQSRSWLSLWSNTNVPSEKSTATIAAEPASATPSKEVVDTSKSEQRQLQPADDTSLPSQTSSEAADVVKPQGWSFWSKDRSNEGHTSSAPKDNIGKLAIAGPSSQSQPENAVVDQAKGLPSKLGKKGRPHSLEVADDAASLTSQKVDTELRQNTKATKILPVVKSTERATTKPQRTANNLLLPPFKCTYRIPEKPSLLQHLSRILHYTQVRDTKHLDLVPNPHRIRRALAIVSMSQRKCKSLALELTYLLRASMVISQRH